MSATLTWHASGPATKTGTTQAAFMTDIAAMVSANSGDSNFKWQVASSNDSSAPYYVVLKRKDASAGRVLFVAWTSTPAGFNTAILDQNPSTTAFYVAYFPAGNVDTPSNLTASSGTILGDDTGAVKVVGEVASTIYGASVQPFYFDSTEGVLVGMQNPASVTCFMLCAGDIVVDAADAAYSATLYARCDVFGDNLGAPTSFSASKPNAGTTAGAGRHLRTNYSVSNNVYYTALTPNGAWADTVVGSTDILTDTSVNKAWFVPTPLVSNIKGGGFPIKLRQIGWGPGTTSALEPYSTTGPVVAARQFNVKTDGGTGYPWVTNFKI